MARTTSRLYKANIEAVMMALAMLQNRFNRDGIDYVKRDLFDLYTHIFGGHPRLRYLLREDNTLAKESEDIPVTLAGLRDFLENLLRDDYDDALGVGHKELVDQIADLLHFPYPGNVMSRDNIKALQKLMFSPMEVNKLKESRKISCPACLKELRSGDAVTLRLDRGIPSLFCFYCMPAETHTCECGKRKTFTETFFRRLRKERACTCKAEETPTPVVAENGEILGAPIQERAITARDLGQHIVVPPPPPGPFAWRGLPENDMQAMRALIVDEPRILGRIDNIPTLENIPTPAAQEVQQGERPVMFRAGRGHPRR